MYISNDALGDWKKTTNPSFCTHTHTPLPPIYLLSYLSAPPRITAARPSPALSARPLPTSFALSPAAALPPVIGIATLNAVEEEGTILTRTARLHTHSKCICSGNVALSMSQRCRHRRRHRQPNTPHLSCADESLPFLPFPLKLHRFLSYMIPLRSSLRSSLRSTTPISPM